MALLCAFALSACAGLPADPKAAFFANLKTICGQAFEGRLAAGDPVLDRDFAQNPLRMGPVRCAADRIEIPFAVGADHSRTWIITRTGDALQLKHRHAHGEQEDALSQYGGLATAAGEATRQDFPADAFSIALFVAQGRAVSTANIWTLEITPGRLFAYALKRPQRHVRVEFDLATPPARTP